MEEEKQHEEEEEESFTEEYSFISYLTTHVPCGMIGRYGRLRRDLCGMRSGRFRGNRPRGYS